MDEMNVYIFKKSGKCYHVRHCHLIRYALGALGDVDLITKEEAERMGYKGCKKCGAKNFYMSWKRQPYRTK